ncbi:hypothetical protein [Stenotrophomonas nematodicola]|uniref:Transmembrane protein n=1 Tax=Stenotrophomonas nematodicola TaxID=2656746 RepID=A0ABW7D260_9GAMM
MEYVKRWLLAASSAAFIVALYILAAQPRSMITVGVAATIVLKCCLFGLVAGALAALIIRKSPVAMVLLSQVLIMLILTFIWNR